MNKHNIARDRLTLEMLNSLRVVRWAIQQDKNAGNKPDKAAKLEEKWLVNKLKEYKVIEA